MLQGYTVLPVTHEQATVAVADSTDIKSTLDLGSSLMTLAEHPQLGDIIVIENSIGKSAIALQSERAKKISN